MFVATRAKQYEYFNFFSPAQNKFCNHFKLFLLYKSYDNYNALRINRYFSRK